MRLVSLLLILGACGGIGEGNRALLVAAKGEFDGTRTLIEIEVFRDGFQLSEEASVQIGEGEAGVLQPVPPGGGDKFRLELDGYVQTLRIRVTAGEDSVEATFAGPSPLVITSPAQGQVFDVSQGEDVVIAWEGADKDEASSVTLEIKDFTTTLDGDPGELTVPFSQIPADANRVEITRTNIAELRGGARGSFFQISAQASAALNVQ